MGKQKKRANHKAHFHELKIIRVERGHNNVYIWARHPGWNSEYSFCILDSHTVKGQTSSGLWNDLSPDIADIIRGKLTSFIISRTDTLSA
ncbi:MAG: hypothetical protein JXD21_00230 [Candidatus Omnitrophica bacterium]|nr:hypothetical protein [Candidatus Omnitrophota bacterium]